MLKKMCFNKFKIKQEQKLLHVPEAVMIITNVGNGKWKVKTFSLTSQIVNTMSSRHRVDKGMGGN